MLFYRQVLDDHLQRQNISGRPPLKVSILHIFQTSTYIKYFIFRLALLPWKGVAPPNLLICQAPIILFSGFLRLPHPLLHQEHPPQCLMPCRTRFPCRCRGRLFQHISTPFLGWRTRGVKPIVKYSPISCVISSVNSWYEFFLQY